MAAVQSIAPRDMSAGEAMALAKPGCAICMGLGKREGANERRTTCHCVWRQVFRICFARFRSLYLRQGAPIAGAQDPTLGRALNKPQTRVRPEDYLADFLIIARRTLISRTFGQQIFKYHFLYGADWKLCARKLKVDRGNYFHEVYRVEQRIGQALYECVPFALFPLDEYFCGTVRGAATGRSLLAFRTSAAAGGPLRAPLSMAA